VVFVVRVAASEAVRREYPKTRSFAVITAGILVVAAIIQPIVAVGMATGFAGSAVVWRVPGRHTETTPGRPPRPRT
jgi:hypothetical protein